MWKNIDKVCRCSGVGVSGKRNVIVCRKRQVALPSSALMVNRSQSYLSKFSRIAQQGVDLQVLTLQSPYPSWWQRHCHRLLGATLPDLHFCCRKSRQKRSLSMTPSSFSSSRLP